MIEAPTLFPSMSPLEASAYRVLCGEGRHLPLMVAGSPFEFTFQLPDVEGESPASDLPIEISGEVSLLRIQFRPDGFFTRRIPGGLPPGPDLLRKALLSVMCRELLDALAGSLNLTLKVSTGNPPDEKGIALRFVIRSQKDPSGEPEAWGILQSHPKLTGALIAAAGGWPRHEGPLSRSLQLDCPMVLASLSVPSKELLSLRQGDMLVLGVRGNLYPEIRLPDGRRFKCQLPPEDSLIDSLRLSGADAP